MGRCLTRPARRSVRGDRLCCEADGATRFAIARRNEHANDRVSAPSHASGPPLPLTIRRQTPLAATGAF